MTSSRLHGAFVSEVQDTYVTRSVEELNFGWVDPSALVRQPLLQGWDPATSGVVGSLLGHPYVWVPNSEQWKSHSRGDGFAWAYFRRAAALPFVAVIDTGVNIMFESRPQLQRGGMFRHERTAYACAFGLSVPLGSWQVGAIF